MLYVAVFPLWAAAVVMQSRFLLETLFEATLNIVLVNYMWRYLTIHLNRLRCSSKSEQNGLGCVLSYQ